MFVVTQPWNSKTRQRVTSVKLEDEFGNLNKQIHFGTNTKQPITKPESRVMFLQTNPPEIDFTTRVQPWNLRFFPSERVNRLYVWHKIIECTSQSAGDAHSDAAAPAKLVFLSYHDLWRTAIDSADKIYLDWFASIASNHDTSIDGAHTTRKSRRHDSQRVSKVDFFLAQCHWVASQKSKL